MSPVAKGTLCCLGARSRRKVCDGRGASSTSGTRTVPCGSTSPGVSKNFAGVVSCG